MEYDPTDGGGEEMERFWNDLTRVVDRLSKEYRLYGLGDLNGCVGKKVRVGITGPFGVPGEYDNERRVIEFCAKRKMSG